MVSLDPNQIIAMRGFLVFALILIVVNAMSYFFNWSFWLY